MNFLYSAENLRSNYLINPKFQLAFIAYASATAGLALGLIFVASLVFILKFRTLGADIGLPADHFYHHVIGSQVSAMIATFVLVSLLVFALIIASGVLLSHWVAGPIHRLHEHMQAVARGESVEPMEFRRNDCFPEVAEAYNQVLLRLAERSRSNP